MCRMQLSARCIKSQPLLYDFFVISVQKWSPQEKLCFGPDVVETRQMLSTRINTGWSKMHFCHFFISSPLSTVRMKKLRARVRIRRISILKKNPQFSPKGSLKNSILGIFVRFIPSIIQFRLEKSQAIFFGLNDALESTVLWLKASFNDSTVLILSFYPHDLRYLPLSSSE